MHLRGAPEGAFRAACNATGCSSTTSEGTDASRRMRVRSSGLGLRRAPEGAFRAGMASEAGVPLRERHCAVQAGHDGESISPEGRVERSDWQGTVYVSHDSTSPSMHAPSSCRVGLLTHAQWCARHSACCVFCCLPCTPHVVAALAVSSLVHVRQSNNSCWLEHGHPGAWRMRTSSVSIGSWVGRPSAENDCAPVLSHSPWRASARRHGWAGVRDVSFPEDPVSRHLVTSTWLRVADSRNLDLSRKLNHVTPGLGGVDVGQI